MKVAERVRVLMSELGLQQKDLAFRAGVAQSNLSRFLQGKGDTQLSTIEKIAAVFGLKASELLADDSPPPRVAPSSLNPKLKALVSGLESKPKKVQSELAEHLQWFVENIAPTTSSRPPAREARITFVDDEWRTSMQAAADRSGGLLQFRPGFRRPGKGYVASKGYGAASSQRGAEPLGGSEEEKLRQIPDHYWEQLNVRDVMVLHGDSLNLLGYVDRDLIFMRRENAPRDGDIIVCEYDGLVYVKVYRKRKAAVELESYSTNPEHKTIAVTNDSFRCLAVVEGRSGYGLKPQRNASGGER